MCHGFRSTILPEPLNFTSESHARVSPLSPTVKALGAVSLCTDVSSEMVYPITPILLTKVLGAPAWAVGLIEGLAETATSLLKLYSGGVSDRTGKRKPLTLLGYGLAAITKPVIGFAGAWWQVLAARIADRVGKGLRTAPRDALIAESTPEHARGRAFGLHRALDTTGAIIGPLIGYWYLSANPGSTELSTSWRLFRRQ